MGLILEYKPQLSAGTITTIEPARVPLAIALAFGRLGARTKLSASPLARRLAGACTTPVRGVPDIVLVMLVFFGGQVAVAHDVSSRRRFFAS